MAEVAATMAFVPHAEYDLSQWTKSIRQYPTKPNPTAPKPNQKHPKDQS